MDPIEEQRLRDEVIYLHSLWHQGPPRTPNPILNSSRTPYISNVSHWHQPIPPYPNPNPRLIPTHNPASTLHHPINPTPFKKFTTTSNRERIRTKTNSTKNQIQSDPLPDSGPEWPCQTPVIDPPPATSGWPALKPHSAPATMPMSPEERAKFTVVQMQNKVIESCREFFAKRVNSDSEEDDSEDKGDEDYWMEKGDGVEESKEFEFFMRVFKEDIELRNYYEKNYEGGEFCCLVCGGIGEKGWRRFKDCLGLLQHSTAISKTKKKWAHRDFAQVVCKVLGWDIDRLPVIVLKGEQLGRSLANLGELQGEPKENAYGNKDVTDVVKNNANSLNGDNCESVAKEDSNVHQNIGESMTCEGKPKGKTDSDKDKDESDLVKVSADSVNGNNGESVSKEISNVHQNNGQLMLCENSMKEDDANKHMENIEKGISDMGAEGAREGLEKVV